MPDTPAPPRVPAAEAPGLRALLTVVVGVVVVVALALGRDVLIPITLAILLSFVLAPVVELLKRLWLPRAPAVILAALLALGGMVVLGGLIGTQVASLATEVPRYAYTIERKWDAVRDLTVGRLTALQESVNLGLGRAAAPEAPAAQPTDADAPKPIPVEVIPAQPGALEVVQRLVTPVLHPLTTAAIVFVVAIFILLQREDLRDRLIRLVGATDLHRTTTALDEAARRLSRYFLTQLTINTAYGVVTWLVLLAIGVPGALLWGILAGLMRFVPYIGTPIAAIPPIALAAAVDPGWTMALLTLAFFAVGEAMMGYVVEPLAFGTSTGLSPTSVIVAAIFWSWIWGPIGLILAMPLTLCLVVLGRHVERLEFLDVLLGDRPALTPPESFYQRMLAGDPDEALDQAETLLKARPLSSYYDEVVLKGLQLAAADSARGVLPAERLGAIRDSARSVVADLAGHADASPALPEPANDTAGTSLAEKALPVRPPPQAEAVPADWRDERAVLCIAGRGPLDEVAATMLAQLLVKHGVGARMIPHVEVSRDAVGRLDPAGVRMVCVSYLEITGSPAHLRYLLRRLKQRLPGVPILVGLWPAEEAVLSDKTAQAAIGADAYASSLHGAVTACLERAAKEAEPRTALAAE